MGRYRKVYVLAPAGITTGGVELAHQLVDALNILGQDAYVVYVRDGGIARGESVPEAYRKYRISTEETIEDAADNMLVLPEIYFDFMYRYPSIRIGCWWMSVDNHYYSACLKDMLWFNGSWKDKAYTLYRYLKGEIRFRNSHADLRSQSERIVHFYQSVYAREHLKDVRLEPAYPLSDYIHPDLFTCGHSGKENIILYNPKKGGRYVEMLRKRLPGFSFIPLRGFSREQLNALFDRAKLYVDFGPFPGKDRIPREAVIHGCCLITSNFGAAAFQEDLPVPETYKIDMDARDAWKRIIVLINAVFGNYPACRKDFDLMREHIFAEQETFFKQVEAFFI